MTRGRRLLRRVLTASATDVTPGGESGWWQYLVPALIVVVVAFGAVQVRSAASDADRAARTAAAAARFTTAVDGARTLALASPKTPSRILLRSAERDLRALERRAPDNETVSALAPAFTIAQRSHEGLAGVTALAAVAERDLSVAARSASERERERFTLTLVGGLLLTVLLMWIFWARRTRVALAQSERRFRSLVDRSSELVAVLDDHGRVVSATAVFQRRLGHEPSALAGTPLLDLVHPDDREGVDFEVGREEPLHWRLRHADGTWHATEAEWSDLRHDPAVGGFVVTMRDVSDRIELTDRLHHQAFHDGLTGLPNRALFEDRAGHALERLRRNHDGVAVLSIDLDDFKAVNDSLGHPVGDLLLREFALRLAECTRRADTAARFGGDEFGVLVEGPDAMEAAAVVAERVHESLDRPVELDGEELYVHASIGIAAGTAELTAEDLIRNADLAMSAAKTLGKGRTAIFEESMHSAARKRLQLSVDLRRAVHDRELRVAYQPLVRLSDGHLLGAEALLRWNHPTLGDIPPLEFIPLAEENGLIIPIGTFVLREACRQLVAWQREHPENHPDYISVNLSARQFTPEGQIVEDVRAATRDAGMDPARLMLEITESTLMRDRDAIVRDLHALRKMGVRIAIDDFGTGYSALSYLRQLPVDTVKMDRSFVSALGAGSADAALIRSVVELGEALKMQIVAEGIEGQEQLDSVAGLRCEIGQGYFFSPPVFPDGMRLVLDEQRRERL
jgi:diguanylate cyclase (GGDEF)-like protein/PAS domain S-box-containing protein